MIPLLKKYANTIENIAIAVVTVLVINFIMVKPLRNEMNEQFKIVSSIAAEPRYSISNDFEKMRAKENSNINLVIDNQLTDNHIELSDSTTKEEVKKGLFRRIFKKK